MNSFHRIVLTVSVLSCLELAACQGLVPRDTQSLLIPRFHRSEIFGFVAGLGTTFAGLPDLPLLIGVLRSNYQRRTRPTSTCTKSDLR
jgi:hypothetical protein